MDQTAEPFSSGSPPEPRPAAQPQGCLRPGMLIFMAFWILITTQISQSIIWILEQQLFQGALDLPDLRWLVSLGYGLAILVPAVIILLALKNTPTRRYYRAFGLAAVLVLVLVPARLAGITAALETALLQIVLLLLFLLLDRLAFRRIAVEDRAGQPAGGTNWHGFWPALLAVALLGLPWVMWGAAGSVWDILLNFAAALLFGLVVARIVTPVFHQPATSRTQEILLNGFVAALAIEVAASGLGMNGNQGLLTMMLPVVGWIMAALYHEEAPEAGHLAGRVTANRPALALLTGLAAFWPLAMIDPDELAVIIASGTGELIQWANQAAFVSLLIGIALALVFLVLRSRLAHRPARFLLPALLAWGAVAALYVVAGQPGLHGERLFVILRDQADVSQAAQIEDDQERRAYVYNTLVEKANETQANLRAELERWNIPYRSYYLENALEVQGGPIVRWWLSRRPEVDRVLDNPVLRPLPEPVPPSEGESGPPAGRPWNLAAIRADRVWDELGVRGAGIVVGQSDSGVQGDHPELADSYRGRDGDDNYDWFDPWNGTSSPTDTGGHGTHTLGTVLGNRVGVAPDAEWIGCVNLARNLGNPALYLECMQFTFAPFPQGGDPLRDGRPDLGAHVLNNSWGCPEVEGCDPNALLHAVTALRAAGVFVAASAGNEGEGGCGSVSSPIALYDPVYSVGAIDEAGNLAPFSSLGPVEVDGSGRTKPDIVAPGVQVLSAFPGGTYSAASGTSMAGPHVAGVVALMWSANPELIGEIDRTEEILNSTARPYMGPVPPCVTADTPNNAVGYGIVDAYEAVRLAMEAD